MTDLVVVEVPLILWHGNIFAEIFKAIFAWKTETCFIKQHVKEEAFHNKCTHMGYAPLLAISLSAKFKVQVQVIKKNAAQLCFAVVPTFTNYHPVLATNLRHANTWVAVEFIRTHTEF